MASFFCVAEAVAFVCLPLAGGWALGRAGEQAGRVAIASRQAVGPGIHYAGGIDQAGEELAGNPGAGAEGGPVACPLVGIGPGRIRQGIRETGEPSLPST